MLDISGDINADTQAPQYLLVDGGVASAGGHPDLFVKRVTDGICHVDGGVCFSPEDHPEDTTRGKQ